MAQDITEQATQDELADSLVSEPEEIQEPQEQTGTEETELSEEPTEQPAEEQVEEEADDWLPSEQEKVFPDEVLARYAKRYDKDEKWLSDPLNKQILVDKINSDIYLQQIREQQEQAEQEVEQEETEQRPEPTQPIPQLTFEQHLQNIQSVIKQRTSPEMEKYMFTGFMKAFGVADAEIAALAPTQAKAFTEVLSVGAFNLLQTVIPDLIGSNISNFVEQAYPEFGSMYTRAAAANTWDHVRASFEGAELPSYGTRDYAQAARSIGAEIAGSAERFEAMTFHDKWGNPLSARDNLAEKQRMIAERMLKNEEKPTPALVAKALQTGQKIAQRAQVQRTAGNLSSGKSKGQIAQTGEDDFWSDGLAEYQKQHGSL